MSQRAVSILIILSSLLPGFWLEAKIPSTNTKNKRLQAKEDLGDLSSDSVKRAEAAKNTEGILPHWKAQGVDFFGTDDYYYIARSDVGVYLKSKNFNEGSSIQVFDLHLSCRGGDHYLAHVDDRFYVIKGNMYRRVENLNTDEDAHMYSLHRNCQGGDHYLSRGDYFYIVFKDRGVYRKTSNMNEDSDANEYPLHPNCKNGLYYWGRDRYSYFVKPLGRWGLHYHKTSNMNEDSRGQDFSFHRDILNFLPGGLSLTQGNAFGRWELVKSFGNTSPAKASYTKEVSLQKGFKKSKLSTIEHNWSISTSYTYSAGDLSAAFAKHQFSVTASYGGKKVDTTTESWDDVKTVKEKVHFELKPGDRAYFWQYVLGLGSKEVLFCRDLRLTASPSPPTDVPLKSSQ